MAANERARPADRSPSDAAGCPDRATLRAFAQAELPRGKMMQIGMHLTACPRCLHEVESNAGDKELIACLVKANEAAGLLEQSRTAPPPQATLSPTMPPSQSMPSPTIPSPLEALDAAALSNRNAIRPTPQRNNNAAGRKP